MIRWLAVRVALAASLLFLPWGCATVHELIDPPRLTYLGMIQQPDSLFASEPTFRIQVENTNPRGFTIDRVAYDLKIDGRSFLKGVSAQNKRVQAASDANMEISINFNYLDLFPSVTEFSATPSVAFDLTCAVQIPPFSVPFHTKGTLALPRMPALSLKGVRPGTKEEGPVTIIRLKNPNAFAVSIDGLDYTLRAADREVGTGVIRQVISLPAKGDMFVEMPMTPVEGPSLTAPPWDISGQMLFRIPGRGNRVFPFRASAPESSAASGN